MTHNEGYYAPWVREIWTMNGLSEPRYVSRLNNEIVNIRENVRVNASREIPAVEVVPAHSRTLAIVGGGPSLKDYLVTLQLAKARGAEVWALNGAYPWLVERALTPNGFVMLDSRRENVVFINNPQPETVHYLASQVHPDCFEALAGFDVRKWTGWFWGIDDPNQIVIEGGATVGLKAICLAYILGYRKFQLYGFDSSYADGENHAYPQPMNAAESMTEVVLKGKRFTAAKWMVSQVREFHALARLLNDRGCEVDLCCDGLLRAASEASNDAAPLKQVI